MNLARHALLTDHPRRVLFQAAAQRAGATVDEVVRAGLGRTRVPPAAKKAAQELRSQDPQAFRGLDRWPEPCSLECGTDLRQERPHACPDCSLAMCKVCSLTWGGRCPPCFELFEYKRRQLLEMGASLAEGASLGAPSSS